MNFSIYREIRKNKLAGCFYQLQAGNSWFVSEAFPDEKTAIEGIRALILSLRQLGEEQLTGYIKEKEGLYWIAFEVEKSIQSSPFETVEAAREMLLELKAGAEEEVFKVKVWEPQQKDKKESVEKPEYHFDLSDRSQFNQSSAYHPLVADLRFKFYLLSQQDRHFFLFEDADRQTFLFSPCFPEIHQRNLHLDSFLRNAGNESRWKVEKTEEGQYFLLLKTIRGRELARSRNFDTAEELVDLRSRFFEEIKGWESYLKPGYSQRTGLEDKIDNYDKTVFSESGIPGPEIFPFPFRSGEKLQYYFQINDESGKLLLYSEGYESAQGRDKGLLSVLRNSYYLPRYVIVKDAEQYGFRLYAGNRQEISRSWLFYTLEELKSKICWLRSQLADWQIMLGVRPSWLMIRQVKILIEKKQLPLIPPVPDLAESETPGEGPQPEVEGEELTDETEPEVIPGEIVEEEHIVERGIPDEDSVYPEEKEPEAEEEEPVEEELEPPYVPEEEPSIESPPEPVRPPKKEIPVYTPPIEPQPVKPCTPVFKPMEAYQMKDKALFWGRQAEVEALYQKTFNSRLLILCGERGTGKTSLIQCGLANRIQEGRWNPIYIPGNQKADRVLLSTITLKLNAVFDRELGKAETGAYSETRPEIKTEALKALKQLYEWTFQPIFLIFDQLEDRFDAGDKKELDAFFDLLKKIIEDKGFPCKIILILREAHLGALARYEELIPGLLDHRYHLGIMQPDTLRPAVSGMLDILQNTRQIQLTQPELVKDHITNQLNQKKCPPKLGCLQIYLHQLHQDACRQSKGEMPVFDLQLINRVGSSEKAIDSYIRSRRKSLEKQVSKGKTKSPSPAVIRELEQLDFLQNQCCSPSAPMNTWLFFWRRKEGAITQYRNLLWLALAGLLAIILFLLIDDPISSDPQERTISIVDTLYIVGPPVRDTMIDTVYIDRIIEKAKPPDEFTEKSVTIINNTKVTLIGPLYFGFPRGGDGFTWLEAFQVCREAGMYLPCEGEIKYILDKNYRSSASAYDNLKKIFNFSPAQFWSATESEDETAWTYRFESGRIRWSSATDKLRRLPCACVSRNREKIRQWNIPDCYDKEINFLRR